MSQHEQTWKDDSQTVHQVFIRNYDKLITMLSTSIANLSRHFVAKNLITPEEEEEIVHAGRDKARLFLYKIEAPVRGGFTAGLHIMLDIMLQYGSVTDRQLAGQIKTEIDEECKNERLEDETKEVDVRRQEHISSLTLQLKRESDQKAIVEQLQQKIAEEGERHKQMEYNLDKEKQNNRRLYEQYLKTLKDLQHLHDQHRRLKAEKTNTLLRAIEAKQQVMTLEQDFKEEQQKCKIRDLEISSLKEQLQAAEVGFKKDNEEWRKDYDELKKEYELFKEKNEELEKENKFLEKEVDDLKGQLQAAELALKKDDEEWRQDYDKICEENKSLKEEIDSLKEETESIKQEKEALKTEKDTLKEENEALNAEKENTNQLHQNHLDAVLLSHKADGEEWRLEYQNLTEKYDSLKLENDKLLKQQLQVALIGRRASIEEMENMETSLQTATQDNAVLKVAHEEAEREITFLNNDKSTFNQKIASLEEQLRIKEKEFLTASETADRELAELKAKLVSVVEENRQLQQSLSVELHSQKQWSLPQQSLYNELNNLKVQLTKTRAENEKMHQLYGESLNKANMLQSEVLSTKTQLLLQKELQERDAKLLQMKDKREEELRATIDKLNQKIESLERECVKVKQTHGILTRTDYLEHSKATVNQGTKTLTGETHSSIKPQEVHYLLMSDPMQSLSASLYQSQTSERTFKSNETHPVPQATASLRLRSTSDVVEPVPVVSSSMPSLRSSSTSSYTTTLYVRKSVCTAGGQDAVMCKQIMDVADLSCGQRVITQTANDKYEYGTVQAFPKYINGKMNFVGIELDLPNGRSDGSADNIYHFHCKPNHGLFVPVDKLFRIVYTL